MRRKTFKLLDGSIVDLSDITYISEITCTNYEVHENGHEVYVTGFKYEISFSGGTNVRKRNVNEVDLTEQRDRLITAYEDYILLG
jgi:hypothetical protein